MKAARLDPLSQYDHEHHINQDVGISGIPHAYGSSKAATPAFGLGGKLALTN